MAPNHQEIEMTEARAHGGSGGLTARAKPVRQEIDYENERKENMVSSQEIWLGLGTALRVAGMGCDCGVCGFAFHGGCALTSWQAFRPLDCVGHGLGGCYDYYLPRKRRETALALGKGLAFAYDLAA